MYRIRAAQLADVNVLVDLINRAYRPTSDLAGWTHESAWVAGDRITRIQLSNDIQMTGRFLLLAADDEGKVAGCVQLMQQSKGVVAIGLLTVDPALQTQGLGKRLLQAAETFAVEKMSAMTVEIAVVHTRTELMAYYQRRGYHVTDQQRPYPVGSEVGEPKQELHLMVMRKALFS